MRDEYPALSPHWEAPPKKRNWCGSGLARRYMAALPDGTHGESKRGWGPSVYRPGEKKTKGVPRG